MPNQPDRCVRFASLIFSALVCGLATGPLATAQEVATMILQGGHVVTVDSYQPEAEAVALKGDRILAVGSSEAMLVFRGEDTQVIDLKGRLAIPGFIDGHAHLVGLGATKMMLDLGNVETWDEIVAKVALAAKSAPPGKWIIGRGWHQEKWTEEPSPNVDGYPVHAALSAASPDNPVLLTHVSGHMCFANMAAMTAASVDKDTPDPEGGEILRNQAGEPIGVFRETATIRMWLAEADSRSEQSFAAWQQEQREAAKLAMRDCLSKGVTSFQDAGSTFATADVLRTMADNGELDVRLWIMIRESVEDMDAALRQTRITGYANHFLTVGGLKLMFDGALGAHGAWLLEPYSDMPTSRGLNTAPLEQAHEFARLAMQHNYQLCVHAIGDRANREILNVFESSFAKHPDSNPRRWRIEHAQHIHPEDIPRFAELGVIASMQGVHCTSDAVFVPKRLGIKRSQEGAYVWQSLWKSGALVTNGTDAPVEDVNPIQNFHALVTRELQDGSTFFPAQKLTREQALQASTINCAYAAFEEDIKGSITPGKLADIVILSKDIMTCPEAEIRKAKVDYTIVGGKIAYQAPRGLEKAKHDGRR